MAAIDSPAVKSINRCLLVTLGVLCAGLLLLTLTPPYARDALIHHLAIPKLWVRHGGFYETPWAPFSYYPMNIELIYLLCLIMGSDILPKVVHLCFALGAGVLIYAYLRPKLGQTYALLGLLIWLSTPIVIHVASIAYIDLGVTFLVTAALYCAVMIGQGAVGEKRPLLLSSVLTGLALGSKYTALIILPFLAGVIFLQIFRDGGLSKALKLTFIYLLLSVFVASPWYVKNLYLKGNPTYPFSIFFSNRLQQNGHDLESLSLDLFRENRRIGSSSLLERRVRYSEDTWEILLVPLRVFWQGKDNSPQFFDGVLNPILLIFFPFAWYGQKEDKSLLIFLLFAWFFILMVFFLRSMRIRYIIPALPSLVIVSVFGIRNIISRTSMVVRYLVVALVVTLVGLNFIYLGNRLNFVKPWRYLSAVESRDAFLSRLVGSYRPILWMNRHLPPDARVLFLMAGHRGYYCEREYLLAPNFGQGILDKLISSQRKRELREIFSELGVTHLFTNHHLIFKYLETRYPRNKVEAFRWKMDAVSEVIYSRGPFSILEIKPSPQ